MASWKDQAVIIVGGGIGGLSAALALERKGIPSQLVEQAPEFKEIGAGIQLGPNVFRMFDVLGLTAAVSALAVFPNNLIMLDSVSGEEVTRIPLGNAFRKKFTHPYALIHRADLHKALLEACRKSAASVSTTRKRSSRSTKPATASWRAPRTARSIVAQR